MSYTDGFMFDEVEVIKSSKRKKTVQAKIVNKKLIIFLPSRISQKEEDYWIRKMKKKCINKRKKQLLNTNSQLKGKAEVINKKYFEGKLNFNIEFVTNQNSRFGSCTPENKTIRISDKVSEMPKWVQNYIILHEIAHLIYKDHSDNFWEKVNEYKYTERAKGFLIGFNYYSNKKGFIED